MIFGFTGRAQELRAVARLDALETELEDLRIPLRDNHSLAAWVAQNRRPILQAPGGKVFVGRITGVLLGDADLALLGVPLRADYTSYGVLIFGSTIPNAINSDNVELLKSLGVQVTVAAPLQPGATVGAL